MWFMPPSCQFSVMSFRLASRPAQVNSFRNINVPSPRTSRSRSVARIAGNRPGREPEERAVGRFRGEEQRLLVPIADHESLAGQILLGLTEIGDLERRGVVDLAIG